MKVKIRNLLPVLVNGRGDIFVGRAGEQEYVDIHQLKDRAKDFLLNVMDDPNLPEKEVEEFEAPRRQQMELSGRKRRTLAANDQRYPISDLHHGTERVTRAINEIRDEVSKNKFQMKFSDLGEAERGIVAKAVPMSISEAEPRDLGGKSSMAVIKKKGNKSLPPISTASLPDVIFMILFFFMVSTTMRDQELHVKYQVPEATEVQKLEKKSLVSYIHIGEPIGVWREQYGPAPRIQLNDAFKTAQDIGQFVAAERDKAQ